MMAPPSSNNPTSEKAIVAIEPTRIHQPLWFRSHSRRKVESGSSRLARRQASGKFPDRL